MNRPSKYIPVTVAFLILLVSAAAGDIYTWTDSNGVKHFANESPQTAAIIEQQQEIKHDTSQYREWEAEQKDKLEKILDNGRSDESDSDGNTSPSLKATKNPGKVVIYTTPTCGYCKRAKAFFKEHAIAYTEYDITADPKARQRFRELNGTGVPLIFVGEKRIVGFNQIVLRRLFDIE